MHHLHVLSYKLIVFKDTMPGFEDLLGQHHVKTQLKKAVADSQLAHAWLFFGERGLRMEKAALELATMLMCENDSPPCNACQGCRKCQQLDHPDLQIVFPLPAIPAGKDDSDPAAFHLDLVLNALKQFSKNCWAPPEISNARQISVAQSRHLKRWATLKSFQGGKRIALIMEADKLGIQAQNALLKLLEEPPEDMVLLLCSSDPEKLLPTILSRCQQLRFMPVSEDELSDYLERQADITKMIPAQGKGISARELARLSGGNPGRAFEIASEFSEKDESLSSPASVEGFLKDLLMKNPAGLFSRLNLIDAGRDRELVKRLISDLQDWLQDVNLLQNSQNSAESQIKNLHQLELLRSFASRFRLPDPFGTFKELERLKSLNNRNVHLFILLVALAKCLTKGIIRL
jgi:DNA polymerase III subunit delta'